MSRNQPSAKTIAQYVLFAVVVYMAYRIYSGDRKKGKSSESIRPGMDHPRNVHLPQNDKTMEELDKSWGGIEEGGGGQEAWGQKIEKQREQERLLQQKRVNLNDPRDPVDDIVEGAGESIANDESRKREVNLGEMPRHLPHPELDDLNMQKIRHDFGQNGGQKKGENVFWEDGIDKERLKVLEKRNELFKERVEARAQTFKPDEFKDMYESEKEYLPFATAGSHTTFPATLEFIYSIQYFYPKSEIAIYDIGLLPEEITYINSICNVKVESLLIHLWPEDMYRNRHRTWRPILLQFGINKFAHFVYVEPGRYINKQRIGDYISHSHKHGLTIAGSQKKHSAFSVTHPDMYSFLPVDQTLLQKTPHFDFNMIILHGTPRVRHFFMRYLVACTQEEYCIAPPGSKSGCDINLDRSFKRYANCHRYDESAMNLILNSWHNFRVDDYLMKDAITKHYDGKDVTKKLKFCQQKKDEV